MESLTSKSVLRADNMSMPLIGFGTWQCRDESAIEAALEAGYRHIDTAYAYTNEDVVGNVLERWFKSGKLKREEVFVTTKLPEIGLAAERVERFLKKSLKALKLDYVDLYLVHYPVGFQYISDNELYPKGKNGEYLLDMKTDHLAIWKEMEEQVIAGRAKAIGVSNFTIEQLERIRQNCRIVPANNQVEMHVYHQKPKLRQFCQEHGITICAFSPLGSPGMTEGIKLLADADIPEKIAPLKDPIVLEIAQKHGRPPGNILLRYLLQLGVSVIPKSSNPARIRENFNIFDFELDASDMEKLKKLEKGRHGRVFAEDLFPEIVNHPENPYVDDE